MALVYSPESDKKKNLPDFELSATDGNTYTKSSFKNYDIKVFLFICNHCPYVKAIEDRVISLYKELKHKNVHFIGVCSNDASEYPEDSFENIKKRWIEKDYQFTYLHDPEQKVARSFGAVCTPDIFAYNKNDSLFYRGRVDDHWKDATQVQREDLKLAILAELNGQTIDFNEVPSMGCSIKWIQPD